MIVQSTYEAPFLFFLLGALNLINGAGILTDLYDLRESSLASKPASWTLLWTIVPI